MSKTKPPSPSLLTRLTPSSIDPRSAGRDTGSMKSMTGFGSSTSESELVELEVSVKSVNGRFLEIRFHLPREYHLYEAQMKKVISDDLRRGTIDVSIRRWQGPASSQGEVRIQLDLARKWVRSYQELGRSLGL